MAKDTLPERLEKARKESENHGGAISGMYLIHLYGLNPNGELERLLRANERLANGDYSREDVFTEIADAYRALEEMVRHGA